MILLYNTFVYAYRLVAGLLALKNTKARAWVEGRQRLFERLGNELQQNSAPLIWIHSASTGEFEQAKPVIEAIRKEHPGYKILATFFSPSGYEAAAGYPHIHYRYFLPLDTRANARRFVGLVQPSLVIFSKYDFWHHHLKAVADARIPLVLISAIFRRNQLFFRWYGGFYRSMLRRFSHLFVQDEASVRLLRKAGIGQCSVGGDTRFDRVMDIVADRDAAKAATADIAAWLNGRPALVAGSTWPADEALLAQSRAQFPNLCWIIVPHELGTQHLAELSERFPGAVRYSQFEATFDAERGIKAPASPRTPSDTHLQLAQLPESNVLIVDAMGKLSKLYALATITYVGGGFSRDGIHNTLEAAVWGKPVIIGPNYHKYREARELIAAGAAFSVADAAGCTRQLDTLLRNKAALEAASMAAAAYVQQNAGATQKVISFIRPLLA